MHLALSIEESKALYSNLVWGANIGRVSTMKMKGGEERVKVLLFILFFTVVVFSLAVIYPTNFLLLLEDTASDALWHSKKLNYKISQNCSWVWVYQTINMQKWLWILLSLRYSTFFFVKFKKNNFSISVGRRLQKVSVECAAS